MSKVDVLEDYESLDEEHEILIRVQPSTLSNDIWVMIPHRFWDEPNLAEGIKKAVLITTGQLPDKLDS